MECNLKTFEALSTEQCSIILYLKCKKFVNYIPILLEMFLLLHVIMLHSLHVQSHINTLSLNTITVFTCVY